MTSKVCTKCGEEKPLEEFHRRGKNGYKPRCKSCRKESASRRWSNKEEEEVARISHMNREYRLKRKYGIGSDEYERLLKEQGGRCAICGATEPGGHRHNTFFAVDHCHDSGEIRGLLCTSCNLGIGKLGDTYEAVQRAADYLARSIPQMKP